VILLISAVVMFNVFTGIALTLILVVNNLPVLLRINTLFGKTRTNT